MLNRLIKLLKEFEQSPEKLCPITSGNGNCDTCEYNIKGVGCYDARRADYLLKHGVIAPPCKVGDTVYYINGRYEKQGRKKVHIEFVDKCIVDNMVIGDKGVPQINVCNDENEWTMFDSEDDFGKTVFLTKEEAKQKMKEVKENENV